VTFIVAVGGSILCVVLVSNVVSTVIGLRVPFFVLGGTVAVEGREVFVLGGKVAVEGTVILILVEVADTVAFDLGGEVVVAGSVVFVLVDILRE
jgi:hypothetical protein